MEVLEEIYFQDKDRMQKIDSVAGTLSNGWKLTVHWEAQLVNYVYVPKGETEEEYLDWWESEKPKHIKHFVDFVDSFGLAALVATVSAKAYWPVGTDQDTVFKTEKPILFSDDDVTLNGCCVVISLDINHTGRLIEVFITV